ncbi:outer membrane beta-barrel protein [Methylobacterium sp. E-041]|uniref:outer membrane protein n=1 Tax=Methylobacterium sp. E-041 TaxID=2836573 RepID=UPI001FB92085|nr:outer membrane beta-barrel protein [Methylobacterium sp. E-041]MCJ2108687.1 outer membrane beta-barrel protein [Methylobacterium sp. E-041]
MRKTSRALLAALSLAGPTTARAADLDYDFLRGPDYDPPVAVTAIDWSGVYVGGHGGYSTTSFNFGSAGQSDIAHILRTSTIQNEFDVSRWNTLRPGRAHDVSFGGFAGYNIQIDDAIFGIEVDYTNANQKARSEDSLTRNVTTKDNYFYDAFVHTAARATLEDYGTIRARAGYAYGQFLPFVTGGLAYGRALVGDTVNVATAQYTDSTRNTLVATLVQSGGSLKEKFALGGALGAGVDVSITQNVFLRAEYQYVWFSAFGDNKMNVNTVRGALGVKF